MKFIGVALALANFAFLAQGKSAPGCSLSLNNNLPIKNEPVFLTENSKKQLEILRPSPSEGKDSTLDLKTGQEIVVACPSDKNNNVVSKETFAVAKCESGSTLVINGAKVDSKELDCKSKAESNVIKTDRKCANGKGTVLEIGFKVISEWFKLLEVCHDLDEAKTYWASHTIKGDGIEGKVYRSTARPAFSRGEKWLYTGFNPDNAYKQSNQEKVLKAILGPKSATEYLDSKATKFLARGHLAPDADFANSPQQLATYFFVNAAPQWQSINAGNWLRTEVNARTVAAANQVDLEVVTGTLGVSKMVDDKGKEKEVYMEGKDRLPVPEYYWKILRNPQDDSCMAIVATNNPFLKSAPTPICKDVCKANNWPTYQDDLFKGYVYCCEYKDLKKAVPHVPDVACKSTLKYKKN
ncbi:Endonuclease_NS [Nesidiocoris tenuis]|uniref:Endonuclease_NS n=1 Tax=Nesidiocoris tenuis TaxID=355587 RepID=A0ABN7AYY7_9HEMI|nr:Endonuclease_NS [Nesidiocoris tenuis]